MYILMYFCPDQKCASGLGQQKSQGSMRFFTLMRDKCLQDKPGHVDGHGNIPGACLTLCDTNLLIHSALIYFIFLEID